MGYGPVRIALHLFGTAVGPPFGTAVGAYSQHTCVCQRTHVPCCLPSDIAVLTFNDPVFVIGTVPVSDGVSGSSADTQAVSLGFHCGRLQAQYHLFGYIVFKLRTASGNHKLGGYA